MFYGFGNVAIKSALPLMETAALVARVMEIPPFVQDISTPPDEGEDFVSRCFGLKFIFYELPASVAKDGFRFGLTIGTLADYDYDGPAREVDIIAYVLFLLGREPQLSVARGEFLQVEDSEE